jgi:hypothetical protein
MFGVFLTVALFMPNPAAFVLAFALARPASCRVHADRTDRGLGGPYRLRSRGRHGRGLRVPVGRLPGRSSRADDRLGRPYRAHAPPRASGLIGGSLLASGAHPRRHRAGDGGLEEERSEAIEVATA